MANGNPAVLFPNALPDSVRASARAERGRLNPSVEQVIDDEGYLEHEWELFAAYHRRVGTRPRLVEAVFCKWLKSPQTGERAHEQLKRATDEVAAGLGLEGVVGGGEAENARARDGGRT